MPYGACITSASLAILWLMQRKKMASNNDSVSLYFTTISPKTRDAHNKWDGSWGANDQIGNLGFLNGEVRWAGQLKGKAKAAYVGAPVVIYGTQWGGDVSVPALAIGRFAGWDSLREGEDRMWGADRAHQCTGVMLLSGVVQMDRDFQSSVVEPALEELNGLSCHASFTAYMNGFKILKAAHDPSRGGYRGLLRIQQAALGLLPNAVGGIGVAADPGPGAAPAGVPAGGGVAAGDPPGEAAGERHMLYRLLV
jgi:hypothetical protein